jgi:hypothetical protein
VACNGERVALVRVVASGILAAVVSAPAGTAVAAALAAPSGPPRISSRGLLHDLTVGPTYHAGYLRTKFTLWTSHPDGCDTREKVLIRDALVTPHVGSGCYLTGGKWRSPYDGLTTRDPTQIQVDHMVPLAAAWGAGAWRWTSATREEFANDLGTPYDLLAVSGHTNESKGDSSPDQWLPPKHSFDCRYMADYTAVLWRWKLAISPSQKSFLHSRLRACGWPRILAPTRPAINRHPTGGGGPRRGHAATGIRISTVSFDSPGDDTGSSASLNGEWVEVTNTSSKAARLGQWSLHDEHSSHVFSFPGFRLKSHHAVKVHTGRGTDDKTDLFWQSGTYIWNNDGDTATLIAANGKAADSCHFSGSSPASC